MWCQGIAEKISEFHLQNYVSVLKIIYLESIIIANGLIKSIII